eukprot:3400328-Pleurochrysis_carterae.AAC.1
MDGFHSQPPCVGLAWTGYMIGRRALMHGHAAAARLSLPSPSLRFATSARSFLTLLRRRR